VTLDDARAADRNDPLAPLRDRFQLPPGIIYLDGNSLGALPLATAGRLRGTVKQQWGEGLIGSWHEWIDWPQSVAAKLAPILGAEPGGLLIADSTSICLFKLLAAAARDRSGRSKILTQQGNFPTDLYVAQGVADLLGLSLEAVPGSEISGAIDDDVAAITLTHVDYTSGARLDMRALNRTAALHGTLCVWDLSHSAGAVELDLIGDGCELAVGCGYKYLNGGPGAPAFLYVAERLQDSLANPLPGWMGHSEPFAFDSAYRPAPGVASFLSGTPSILALAALDAGLDAFAGVAMADIEVKSAALSSLFIAEIEARCGDRLRLASPRDAAARGSHLVFAHPHGYAVMQALIAHGVIGDFRAPDLIRFGFAPLYNGFVDVVRAAGILGDILATGEWDQPRFHTRARIT
jgi:kynureninase